VTCLTTHQHLKEHRQLRKRALVCKQERMTLGLAKLLAQLGNDVKFQRRVGEELASQRRNWNAICG
jgi:hypothetical protein